MEHVNKIECLTGTHAKLASLENYVEDINSRLNVSSRIIDIKKEYTYEKGKQSKALMIYVVASHVNQVLEAMKKIKNARCKFVSCKHATLVERLASMHHNDMKNIKAKHESLDNAMLNKRVMVDPMRQKSLKTIIVNA